MHETTHNRFFATYGAILPNIGGFHLCQTMMRSFIKLIWNLDLSELCKSILLESPKSQFMIEKGTEFRKCFDVLRTSHEAKLRELAYPFVKWANKTNVDISLDSYHLWFKHYVKSPTYKLTYEIEKNYSQSLLLFLSSMRANNPTVYSASKKTFGPLLHINNHTTYSQLDIYSDYLDRNMQAHSPKLFEYLEVRKHPNKTGRPFKSKSYDELHEEYNKVRHH